MAILAQIVMTHALLVLIFGGVSFVFWLILKKQDHLLALALGFTWPSLLVVLSTVTKDYWVISAAGWLILAVATFALVFLIKQSRTEQWMRGLSYFVGYIVSVFCFYFVNLALSSWGPIAYSNNDAFWYLSASDQLSYRTLLSISPDENLAPSKLPLLRFGDFGYFRNGLVVQSGWVLHVLNALNLEARALEVVPAVIISYLSIAISIFITSLSRLFKVTQLYVIPLLVIAMTLGSVPQRLLLESFYPASTAAGFLLIISAFFLGKSNENYSDYLSQKRIPKTGFLTAFFGVLFLVNFYPESLLFYAGVFTLILGVHYFVLRRFDVSLYLHCALGLFFALILSHYNFGRFLKSVMHVASVPADTNYFPLSPFLVNTVFGGNVPLHQLIGSFQNPTLWGSTKALFTKANLPHLLSFAFLLFCLFKQLFVYKDKQAKNFLLLAVLLVLPGLVIAARSAVNLNNYSVYRSLELTWILSATILASSILTLVKEVLKSNSKRWKRSFAGVTIVLIFVSAGYGQSQLLSRLADGKVYPSESELSEFERILNSASPQKIGIVGVNTARHRSLLPNHLFPYLAELSNIESVYFQSKYSYYIDKQDQVIQPNFEQFLGSSSFVTVSQLDNCNSKIRKPAIIEISSRPVIVPKSENAFFESSHGECGVRVLAGGSIVFVGRKKAAIEVVFESAQDDGGRQTVAPSICEAEKCLFEMTFTRDRKIVGFDYL